MSKNGEKDSIFEYNELVLFKENSTVQEKEPSSGNTPNIFKNQGSANIVETNYGGVSNVTNIIQQTSNADDKIISISFGFSVSNVKFFTGRSDELLDLTNATINLVDKPPIVVVSGLGGIGKSQLVRIFIDRNRLYYKNVVWINSELYTSVLSEITRLATDRLHISTKSNGKDKDIRSLIEEVFNKLSALKTIIVLDNIDEAKETEIIKIMLTMGTTGIRPHIVMTSRIQEWDEDIHCIPLKPFKEKEALDYVETKLKDKMGRHNDSEEDKKALVEKLQYFPLALVQATAYISHQRVNDCFPIRKYIDEYDKSFQDKEKFLDSKFFQKECNLYAETTFTTWRVTKASIANNECKATGDLALRIFKIIAYFDPDHIRRDIFFHLESSLDEQKTDFEAKVKSAVRLLINYSMLDGDDIQSVLNVHRLVQQVTKIELERNVDEKNTILRDSLHIISEMKQFDEFKECLEHGISVFLEALTCLELVTEYKTFPGMILTNLNDCHKFIRAINFGNEVVEPMKKFLGENDLDTLTCMCFTADSYYFSGDYLKALQKYQEVYEKFKRSLGENNQLTLGCEVNISSTYAKLGKESEALDMKLLILKKRKLLLSENHESTLNIMYNIAVSYSRLGKDSEALQMSREVFDKVKKIPPSRSTLQLAMKAESNIGCMLINLGKFSDALETLQGVLLKRKTAFGENHTGTLNSMTHIAFTYNMLSKYSDAFRMNKEVFEKRTIILPEDHPATLDSQSRMAVSINNLGKYSEALEIHEAVRNKLIQKLGEDHMSTVGSLSNIAETKSSLGQYAEALQLHEAVCEKRKTILGEDHLVTVESLSNVGVCYSNLGDHATAASILQEVFHKQLTGLGEDHPDTLTTKFNIAVSNSNMGHLDKALEMHQEVFKQRNDILGAEHLYTVDSKFRIAILQNSMGNHVVALQMHQDVYNIRKDMLGDDHLDTLNSMSNIADSYSNNLDKALEMHQEVLKKRKNVLGEKHPKVWTSKSNVAALHSYLGEYSKAVEMFEQVFQEQISTLGENHSNTLQSALLMKLCKKDMTASCFCNIL